ncbi:hypothetical protein BLOT_011397 [Blomia tropicalis]|nr:hypothetical protein BLOT_011397 [Blomia tropicalis]
MEIVILMLTAISMLITVDHMFIYFHISSSLDGNVNGNGGGGGGGGVSSDGRYHDGTNGEIPNDGQSRTKRLTIKNQTSED